MGERANGRTGDHTHHLDRPFVIKVSKPGFSLLALSAIVRRTYLHKGAFMQQYVRKVDANGQSYVETDLSGYMLTRSPLLNKGTAFTIEERKELGLLGTLPPHVTPLAEQVQQSYDNFSNFQTPLDKHVFL